MFHFKCSLVDSIVIYIGLCYSFKDDLSNMNRKYSSGAQKRKLAEEKKEKEKQNLAKFPKIRDLFSAVPSTSSASTSSASTSSSLENTGNIPTEIEENAETVVCTPEIQEIESETDTENIISEIVVNTEAADCDESETGGYDTVPTSHSSAAVINFSTDPGLWNVKSDISMLQRYWIDKGKYAGFGNERNEFLIVFFYVLGPYSCRNIGESQHRQFTANQLKRTLANTESSDRTWLIYSPTQDALYCFICRLFGSKDDPFTSCGFNDYHNILRALKGHEGSTHHALNEITYKTRIKESNTQTIDGSITNQSHIEMEYWRAILKRIVAAVKFLGSRGLAYRGANETIGSIHNGNYLGVLELISEFDPLLSSHLRQYGNKGKGTFDLCSYLSHLSIVQDRSNMSELNLCRFDLEFLNFSGRASYLSKNICDEFISLIGSSLMETILAELRCAKYYSISVDSTPDVSHCDQLVFCVRYVRNGAPVERFLQFIPVTRHLSEYLTKTVVDFMEKNSINLLDCRGQSYDNTNNVAGKDTGLQQRILELNPLAVFVPCASHSLNLIGNAAVSENSKAASFFCFTESLYSFFVYSTFRWDLLKEALGPNERVLKRSSGTRWSSKFDAVDALNSNIIKVKDVLLQLINDESFQLKPETIALAVGQLRDVCKFENILMLKIWHNILGKFNTVSRKLQSSDLNLAVASQLYRSLITYYNNSSEKFDEFFQEAKSIYVELQADEYVLNTRSAIYFENIDELRDTFKRTIFDSVLKSLNVHLEKRMKCYSDLDEKFSFLVKLNDLNTNDISEACGKISMIYANDIDEKELITECEIAKCHFFADGIISHANMYSRIIKDELQTVFPNIEIILRIFLSLFVTNVPDERSFSKLKIIKSALRNSMGDEKLNAFSLMSIENELLQTLNFDAIIDKFILLKFRKKHITLSSNQ